MTRPHPPAGSSAGRPTSGDHTPAAAGPGTEGRAEPGAATGSGEVLAVAHPASDDGRGEPAASRARRGEADAFFGRPGRALTGHPFAFGFTAALGVLSAWLLVQALAASASVLILIAVSLFLAIGLNPAVRWLEERGMSRRWAITAVFAAVIVFFVGFGVAVVPPLATQSADFFSQLPAYIGQLQNHPQIRALDQQYQLLDRLQQYLLSGDLGRQVFGGLLGAAGVLVSAVFSALTVLILTLYLLASLRSITALGYRLVPATRRERVRLLGDEVIKRIGGYVAGNLLISLIAGVTTFVFLWIADVPYALALSLMVAITDLIPLVGATIGAAVVTLVGLFVSVPTGIACLIFFIVYQQIENYLIAPRVMMSSVEVPAAATVIAALIGGTLLGVVGALLAIPIAAAIQLVLHEVTLPRQDRH
ncbi:AI-2E family transporter [Actinomadura sp. ATCC 31491]|uniref:AI-2E family transporter n=1 Tax=Actinomadura luzonensis TaxID=2805427 RepID=A0ABT0FTT8_9ACTN|nr:AI-2E family transporter [Actinomadura luzonensis]MCK2215757.1 AI-2E family transporter [Actinomadura luzonensis]